MSFSQVFSSSNADRQQNYLAAFLDEFRIMLVCHRNSITDPEPLVVNTLVPQDHPKNLRRFKFPEKYRNMGAYMHRDRDRSLGAVDRDGPLITDPAQAILMIGLSAHLPKLSVLLVVRIQPLIELACSTRTEIEVPWDEWGRGSVAVEIPQTPASSIYSPTIHGSRLLVMHSIEGTGERRGLRVFDFSRKGSAALPLSDESDSGAERKVLFTDRPSCAFEGVDWRELRYLQSVGDSIAFHTVSLLSLCFMQGAVC